MSYSKNSRREFAAFLICLLVALGGIIKISYSSPVIRLEHFAFISEIVGALATATTLIWLVIERDQLQNEKREGQKRKQAAGVSTWLSSKPGNRQHQYARRIIVLNNNSDAPIYNVIVSIVDARDMDAKGEQTPEEFRRIVDASPPGQAYCHAPRGYEGAGFHPSVEIAFSDADGNHWVRRGNGRLEELHEEPFIYYAISQPPTYEPLHTMR